VAARRTQGRYACDTPGRVCQRIAQAGSPASTKCSSRCALENWSLFELLGQQGLTESEED